ncbi:MAG: spore coat biosynthesis protein F [Candidatus Latescibacteria bacterium]|nr:spore coat biosynthesis protein F [Candidatus Latescibacterota bacterium]
MKVVCTIEARMRSTRLPGKVLVPIMGRPMLELMIERLRRVRRINAIVVATTDNPADQPIEDLARSLGVGFFRGSEEDVMDRVLRAARQAQADVIVETTGDCPVIDPETIDSVIEAFVTNNVDYCANVIERTYPRGMDVEVFWYKRLEEIVQLTTDPTDREHVSTYFYKHADRYRRLNLASSLPPDAVSLRLTVDTPQDLDLITRIYEALYPSKKDFSLQDILGLFERHPELKDINRDIKHKSVFNTKSL